MADLRVTSAGRQVLVDQAAELRVTTAGRSILQDQAAELRVTVAGRSVLVKESAPLRVTSLARQVLVDVPSALRVTFNGRSVLIRPSPPVDASFSAGGSSEVSWAGSMNIVLNPFQADGVSQVLFSGNVATVASFECDGHCYVLFITRFGGVHIACMTGDGQVPDLPFLPPDINFSY